MIPTINKTTTVTRKAATTIDHILATHFVDRTFEPGIFKCDLMCQ